MSLLAAVGPYQNSLLWALGRSAAKSGGDAASLLRGGEREAGRPLAGEKAARGGKRLGQSAPSGQGQNPCGVTWAQEADSGGDVAERAGARRAPARPIGASGSRAAPPPPALAHARRPLLPRAAAGCETEAEAAAGGREDGGGGGGAGPLGGGGEGRPEGRRGTRRPFGAEGAGRGQRGSRGRSLGRARDLPGAALGEGGGVWAAAAAASSASAEQGAGSASSAGAGDGVQEGPAGGGGGKSAKKAPPGDPAPKPGRCRSLEDALKALDLSELQKELDKSLSMFPENPSVWVKDLAGYLNYKLQAPKSDPTLSQHPHDYPYCLVSKELRSTIKALLSKSAGVLELFFDHCIYTMLQELDKTPGDSLHGYRICIQAMLMDKPKVATMNLSKYRELLSSHQNRPAKCLTIMWALGQAGFTDLTEGLKVWLGIMFPVLGIKSLSPYAIAYLDRLLMMHPNLTKGFGMIGPKDFFPLMDFAFMPNNSLSPSLQEQLRQLYPRLKVLAFGAKPETTLHTYFPSFLSRALPSCPLDMQKELLNCLAEGLRLDPLSFNVWRQLYIKHLPQSSLLLNHFLETWDSTSKKVRKSLQETVHSFKVMNEEVAMKGPNSEQDVAACRAACKNLLLKMKASGLPWARLLLVALVFTAGFLMHDIRTHGSFEASASAQVLRSSGILSASQQAWSRVSHFSGEGYSWLEANMPLYYSRMATLLGPNLELMWAKTNETAAYISGKCSAQFAWLSDNLPRLIEWLQTRVPDSVLQGAEYLKELLLFLMRNYFLPAVDYVAGSLEGAWKRWVASCNGEGSWECLRKHVTSLSLSSWTYLQDTTVAIRDWALAIVSGH